MNRRHFVRTSTAAALAGPNLLLHGQNSAGRRLNIAVIGANGKGLTDTQGVTLDHNIVAMVDVDQARLEDAAARRQKYHADAGAPISSTPPRLYRDFRRMFDEMGDQIDGVTVSTPDHTHFQAAMLALQHKKHVCVQKPLCNRISEVRTLHRTATEAGVLTQMGNQGRTAEGQRLAKEWIEQGAIGTLKEIKLWTNRPLWPQRPMDKVVKPVPANLDWDLWQSGEIAVPYFEYVISDEERAAHNYKNFAPAKSNAIVPHNWRGWWKYGAGALGDMGCHIMDATFSILGQILPEKIEVESGAISADCGPEWSRLVYHMPKGRHPALTVTWQDDSRVGQPNKPAKPDGLSELSAQGWNRASSGMAFIGTEGVLFEGDAYCYSPAIYPLQRFTEVKEGMASGRIKKTEPRSPKPNNPQGEWAYCIVNGGKPSSNFDYSCPLSEFVLLGNIAIRAQQAITWDKGTMKVSNDEAANQFISRPAYRDGWVHAS